MKKILVTGGNGQLGSELKIVTKDNLAFDVTFIDIHDLDLTKAEDLEAYFSNKQFDYIINCAAYTAVDKAEEEVNLAYQVNEKLAASLAKKASQLGAIMIHVSTDFVFEGNLPRPLTETDPTFPLSVYGQSKLKGEETVANNCETHFIVRTSWLYSSNGNNFLKTILRLSETRDNLGIVYDQVGTPTFAADLAKVLVAFVSSGSTNYGTYHYSNEGVASWYDFAVAIGDLFGLKTAISPIMAVEYPLPAQRPGYSVMSKRKIKEELKIDIPHWRNSLEKCTQLMVNKR